jgi:2-(1,2-epoxy-1,2-dihydrophenyl)acetyl-CoA isomerase
MDYQHLILERNGGIARITLNRPERLNAMNARLRTEVAEAMEECDRDQGVRVVILTGAGRAFCAGDDLRAGSDPGERDRTPVTSFYLSGHSHADGGFVQTIRAIRNIEKPVIAMVNGLAYGAGFEMTLAADLCIAADTATFCTPYAKRGFAFGPWLLHYYLGIHQLSEMVMLAEPLSAAKAERWGIVNQVVPAADLEQATIEVAEKLARAATKAVASFKWSLNRSLGATIEESWQTGAMSQFRTRNTEDIAEGRAAFAEKREPMFKGL